MRQFDRCGILVWGRRRATGDAHTEGAHSPAGHSVANCSQGSTPSWSRFGTRNLSRARLLRQPRAGFSKSFARYWFAAFHSGVLTFIQPEREPDP